nr:GYF domain-containing protein [uncultured Treponema sp.]
MANWFFVKNGTKQGPISTAQLKTMAQTGEILPDTVIITEAGQKAFAKNIKGLKFNNSTPDEGTLVFSEPSTTVRSSKKGNMKKKGKKQIPFLWVGIGIICVIVFLGIIGSNTPYKKIVTNNDLARDFKSSIPLEFIGPGKFLISPDGKNIVYEAILKDKKYLQARNIDSKKILWTLPIQESVYFMKFAGQGKYLNVCGSGQDNKHYTIDFEEGTILEEKVWVPGKVLTCIATSKLEENTVNALTFSTLKKSEKSTDNIALYKWTNFEEGEGDLIFLKGHQSGVFCADFSPDGKNLISCSNDQTVRIWDVSSCKLLQTIQFEKFCSQVRYAPDGSCFAVTTGDGIMVYDSKSYKLIQQIINRYHITLNVDFSKNGDYLAYIAMSDDAKESELCLYSTKNWQKIKDFHVNTLMDGMAIAPNNHLIYGCTAYDIRAYSVD